MKDHEIAQLVYQLRDIAIKNKNDQCLRDAISRAVNEAIKPTN